MKAICKTCKKQSATICIERKKFIYENSNHKIWFKVQLMNLYVDEMNDCLYVCSVLFSFVFFLRTQVQPVLIKWRSSKSLSSYCSNNLSWLICARFQSGFFQQSSILFILKRFCVWYLGYFIFPLRGGR